MPVVRVHMSNVMNTPAEIIEIDYPIRVDCQRLRSNSGGAGFHKGGEGLHREYRALADNISLTTMFDRRVVPPYGLAGGDAGAPFRVDIVRVNGVVEEVAGKATFMLRKGDLVIMQSSGGGGYGAKTESRIPRMH